MNPTTQLAFVLSPSPTQADHNMQLSTFEIFLLQLRPPLLEYILNRFEVKSIIAVSRASTTLHAIFTWYSGITWDPTRRLRRWFVDTLAFRRLLYRTNAVVSGSFALQLFDRSYYDRSDMDLYARTAGVEDIRHWLSTQGYRSTEEISSPYDYLSGIDHRRPHVVKAVMNKTSYNDPLLAVYNFKKLIASADGYIEILRVQLIVVDTDPVEHILYDFHSTAVMNFITATHALSIFPYSTFVMRKSYISKNRDKAPRNVDEWINKYKKRGFTLVGEETSRFPADLRAGPRFITDRRCWKIPFQDRFQTGEEEPKNL
ncbi:hypothetical protein CVT26_004334 [Gymnopilus dilepis]|uniref:Uncharacterized protein n=1 Tax=Gymnopilus dilepis TaxID=231916 RepID=A0A409X1L7_9AGAR|nr:hypothetical protein CVT26_004334 [Gymnopilus dilepis]